MLRLYVWYDQSPDDIQPILGTLRVLLMIKFGILRFLTQVCTKKITRLMLMMISIMVF